MVDRRLSSLYIMCIGAKAPVAPRQPNRTTRRPGGSPDPRAIPRWHPQGSTLRDQPRDQCSL